MSGAKRQRPRATTRSLTLKFGYLSQLKPLGMDLRSIKTWREDNCYRSSSIFPKAWRLRIRLLTRPNKIEGYQHLPQHTFPSNLSKMNWATIAPDTRIYKGKNLFRWEVSPGLGM